MRKMKVVIMANYSIPTPAINLLPKDQVSNDDAVSSDVESGPLTATQINAEVSGEILRITTQSNLTTKATNSIPEPCQTHCGEGWETCKTNP